MSVPRPPRGGVPPWWFFVTIGLAVVAAVAIALVRSGGDESPPEPVIAVTGPPPSPSPSAAPPSPIQTTPPAVTLGASCSFDPEGYSIDYPQGWVTPDDPAWVCQLFDPAPIVVEPDTEPPIVAVTVYVEGASLEEAQAGLSDPAFFEVIDRGTGTFSDAARPGVILETLQTEELLWPAGTRTYSVLVDRLDMTIVVATNDLAAGDYEEHKRIVLAMAQSLRIGG